MKVGFDVGDPEEEDELQPGYAESVENEDESSGWFGRVIFDFLIVYGMLALVKDALNLIRRR